MQDKKKNNQINGLPLCYKKSRIRFSGKNNKIEFGKNVHIQNCKIKLYGNSELYLDDSVYLEGCTITIKDSVVKLGKHVEALNVTVNAVNKSLLDLGAGSVLTGEFDLRNNGTIRAKRLWCTWPPLIAVNDGLIEFGDSGTADSIIYNSDYHPVYDMEGNHINPNEDVIIGDNVWIGRKVFLLKGTRIGDGSIISSGTVTSKDIPAHSIVAGAPGRVVKRDIVWAVKKNDEIESMFPLTEDKIKDFFDVAYDVKPTLKHRKSCLLLTAFLLNLSLFNAK